MHIMTTFDSFGLQRSSAVLQSDTDTSEFGLVFDRRRQHSRASASLAPCETML